MIDVAAAIRSRRRGLGLTLSALEARCGVSKAMLSAVERGERNPTITVLCNIASGLQCTVGSLVDEIEPVMITQTKAQRLVTRDPETGACRSLLAPALVAHGVELVHYTIPAGKKIGPFPAAHSGMPEHITVLTGDLSVEVDERGHQLGAGDSITYMVTDAMTLSAAKQDVELLLVILPRSEPLLRSAPHAQRAESA